MAIIAIDLEATKTFALKSDPDYGTENETRWTIKTLDSRVMGYLFDKSMTFSISEKEEDEEKEVPVSSAQNKVNFEICQFALTGWSNFKDAKGNDIEFATVRSRVGSSKYDIVKSSIVNRIPLRDQRAIADKVKEIHQVNEDEVKN